MAAIMIEEEDKTLSSPLEQVENKMDASSPEDEATSARIVVSPEDYDLILNAIENPPEPNDYMKESWAIYKQTIRVL